eukprot:snap_masked-scaffold_1-processed-gene-16.46-mRNA-1 protein AED:1.00 eAED:1.00 QI:0/-1/0/0/-1/1/1/0/477
MKAVKANNLPRLGEENVSFIHWKDSILSFLGKKHLKVYVLRDVRNPIYIKADKLSLGLEVLFTEEEIFTRLKKEVENFKFSKTKTYDSESVDTPMMYLKLSLDATVVTMENKKVFQFFRDRKKCIEAKLQYAAGTEEVKTVLRATVTMDLMHYINQEKTAFECFTQLSSYFEKSSDNQLIKSERYLQEIKFSNMQLYLNEYKKIFAQCQTYGGVSTKSIVESFIRKVPDNKYGSMKFMCSEEDLNKAIEFFVKVQEKMELRFNSYEDKNTSMIQNDGRINKLKSKPQGKNIKCKRCTGWGHYKAQCPTPYVLCYGCGSKDHKYNSCRFKMIKVNKVDILENDYDDSNSQPEDEDSVENREAETSMYLTKVVQFSPKILKVTAQKKNDICRLKNECINVRVDGGASNHIIPHKKFLKDIKQLKNIEVSGIMSSQTIDTYSGTLSLLLENNICINITNVIVVPSQKETIISESELLEQG